MKTWKVILLAILVITLLAGCGTPQQGAVSGSLGGAAVGAALGAIIGAAAGAPDLGAAIGAGIGGAVGGVAGAQAGAENQRYMYQLHQAKLAVLPDNWKGPNGEITGQLRQENGQLYYDTEGDHLVWNEAEKRWVTED